MVNSRKIKARLIELGFTQKDLADVIGCRATSLNLKINNKRPMTLRDADRIGKFLSLSDQDYYYYFFAPDIA